MMKLGKVEKLFHPFFLEEFVIGSRFLKAVSRVSDASWIKISSGKQAN
jgi:hypothetical protein